jgi:hypothetical protein
MVLARVGAASRVAAPTPTMAPTRDAPLRRDQSRGLCGRDGSVGTRRGAVTVFG